MIELLAVLIFSIYAGAVHAEWELVSSEESGSPSSWTKVFCENGTGWRKCANPDASLECASSQSTPQILPDIPWNTGNSVYYAFKPTHVGDMLHFAIGNSTTLVSNEGLHSILDYNGYRYTVGDRVLGNPSQTAGFYQVCREKL